MYSIAINVDFLAVLTLKHSFVDKKKKSVYFVKHLRPPCTVFVESICVAFRQS